jgi:hypothetical protein
MFTKLNNIILGINYIYQEENDTGTQNLHGKQVHQGDEFQQAYSKGQGGIKKELSKKVRNRSY